MGAKGEAKATGEQKKRYIPGLAAFRFEPDPDWSHKRALRMYQRAKTKEGLEADTVQYRDCIKGMREMPAESVDLVIADPPFGLDFNGKEALYNRNSQLVSDGYHEVKASEYWSFSQEWISELPRIMKRHASAYIFSGWSNLEAVMAAVEAAGLELINHIIWKYQFGPFTRTKFVSSHYHILFIVRDSDRYYFHKDEHYPLDVWDIKRTYTPGEEKNGTKLPVDVVTKCMAFSSKPGSIVFDPFMGNGTTAVGAKGTYRHFYGFEINAQMRPIISAAVESVDVGFLYMTYRERFPDIVEGLKKKYPKAYRVWKRKG